MIMQYVVIAYLWLAILLYLVLGGADFGAGIIELVTTSRNKPGVRKTLYQAIGPVWEANHMWLVIAIVILFAGFPEIYSQISIHLHIPLLIMLMGIIARGTAFAFRHYDAVQDDMQHWYNHIFVSSSFITPLFLGIIAGSTFSGKINLEADGFLSAYVFSWLNWFSVTVGLFTVALCGYLASVYLIGEANSEQDKRRFIRTAKEMNIASVIFGGLVFLAAAIDGVPLVQWVFGDPVGLGSVIAATLSLGLLWSSLRRGKLNAPRFHAGFQAAMILLAANYARFPDFIIVKGGNNFSLFDHIAPANVIAALGVALLIGSVLILPALFYLFYSFENKRSGSGE